MQIILTMIEYVVTNKAQILSLLLEHIQLTAISVGFAILIGVPLGILISYIQKLNKPILGIASVIQAIPSMALLGFAIPLLGIGSLPAIVIVILYSLLPIIKNTYTGISNINKQTVEAAKGIGLTKFQILFKVQIPLALPVIMAGVRISAVTAVGLMTMAAFIGAGGLGYLVFSGIRTVNTSQILAGAVPACILALIVDFLASLVEKLVTPISLQRQDNSSKKDIKRVRFHQKLILSISAVVIVALVGYTFIPAGSTSTRVIKIGSKDFTEQLIISNMVADLIESNTDIQVERHINLGGTQVCFGAIKSGEIDMYIEYTGTAYGDILSHEPTSDMELTYRKSKEEFKEKYDIDFLKQMKFNNTYTLSVTKDIAEKYNLKTISDLAKPASDLIIGTTLEFQNRTDGLSGLTELYNLNFKKTIGIDGSSRYIALTQNDTQVTDSFATDGLLKKYDLIVLEDDKNFFPGYYAVPIVRSEVLEKYPEIEPVLDELGQLLTNDVMIELNYKVDEEQMEPELVATQFLKEHGLYH
jgi:osmoprotectant transport system permease protein